MDRHWPSHRNSTPEHGFGYFPTLIEKCDLVSRDCTWCHSLVHLFGLGHSQKCSQMLGSSSSPSEQSFLLSHNSRVVIHCELLAQRNADVFLHSISKRIMSVDATVLRVRRSNLDNGLRPHQRDNPLLHRSVDKMEDMFPIMNTKRNVYEERTVKSIVRVLRESIVGFTQHKKVDRNIHLPLNDSLEHIRRWFRLDWHYAASIVVHNAHIFCLVLKRIRHLSNLMHSHHLSLPTFAFIWMNDEKIEHMQRISTIINVMWWQNIKPVSRRFIWKMPRSVILFSLYPCLEFTVETLHQAMHIETVSRSQSGHSQSIFSIDAEFTCLIVGHIGERFVQFI